MASTTPKKVGNDNSELEEFEKKIRRCILLDELSPQVTVPMILKALEQFGNVVNVDMLPNNPLDPKWRAKRAVVEMADAKQAAYAVKEIQEMPFMVKGLPRPVTARPAFPNLFHDRPRKSRALKTTWKWVEKEDPMGPLYFELKNLAKKHAAEATYLSQELRKEEEKLAQEQEEKMVENLKKLEQIQDCEKDRVFSKLSRFYGLRYEEGN